MYKKQVADLESNQKTQSNDCLQEETSPQGWMGKGGLATA